MFNTKGNSVSNIAPGTPNKLLEIRVKSFIGASVCERWGSGTRPVCSDLLVVLSKIFAFDETILVVQLFRPHKLQQ